MPTPTGSGASTTLAYVSAFSFVLAAILLFAAQMTVSSAMPAHSWQRYLELDSSVLLKMWEGRRAAQLTAVFGAVFMCVAWFTAIPAVDSFANAMGGPIRSATGVVTAAWKLAAALSVVEFTAEAGAVSTADWMSTWPVFSDPNHTHDGGFGALQALEISFRLTHSRTLWLYAVDRLLLATGFAAASFLVYTSHEGLFSRRWAHLGVLGTLWCIIGFAMDVARFWSWRSFATAASWFTYLLDGFILPAWLIWLALSLKKVRLAGGAYSGGVSGLPGVKAHEVAMASVDPAVDRAQGRIV